MDAINIVSRFYPFRLPRFFCIVTLDLLTHFLTFCEMFFLVLQFDILHDSVWEHSRWIDRKFWKHFLTFTKFPFFIF